MNKVNKCSKLWLRVLLCGGFLCSGLLLQGCSSMYFFPMKEHLRTPADIHLAYEDVALTTIDKVQLHAWFLPASVPVKGRVLFLHGNAENISTHIASVYWLPAQGYEVLLLDYRGYGKSQGEPQLPDVLLDVDAAYAWLLARQLQVRQLNAQQPPMFLFGQSIGASIGYTWFSLRQPADITAVVYDAGFDSFPGMVQRALSSSWVTGWLSYPVSWMFSSSYDPTRHAMQQPAVPRLVLASPDDEIIPFAATERFYQANPARACLVRTGGPHISDMHEEAGRKLLLKFFASPAALVMHCPATW